MALSIGLIGLPQSGKTTLFNALTRSKAETGYTGGRRVNVAVVNVPDERLPKLEGICNPKRVVHAQVQFTEVAGQPSQHQGKGELGKAILDSIQKVDALLLVIKAFEENSFEGGYAASDLETVLLELTLSDLGLVEKRIEKLSDQRKKGKISEAEEKEVPMLEKIRVALGTGRPVKDLPLNEEEQKAIRNYQLLTTRPVLIVLNINEKDLSASDGLVRSFSEKVKYQGTVVTSICGKLESEIAELDPREEAEFISSMGISELGLRRVIRLSFDLLGLICFFTIGPDELRAWPVRRGTPAPQAAGTVHSDMEKGFIRAEVVHFDDLVRFGSITEAKKHGLVMLEGKNYEIKDGDIAEYLFSPPGKNK